LHCHKMYQVIHFMTRWSVEVGKKAGSEVCGRELRFFAQEAGEQDAGGEE